MPGYQHGTALTLGMFVLGDQGSFDSLKKYAFPEKGYKVVVGNKCDRPRQVDGSEAVAYAERIDAVGYVEVSAKDKANTELLKELVVNLPAYAFMPDDQPRLRYEFTRLFEKMGPSCYPNPKFDWRMNP